MDRQIVIAFSLASAQGANSLEIAKDLGLDTRQINLLQPPGQQIRRVRPLAGKNRKFAPAHAQVACHVLHLGRTATIKLRQPCASAAPRAEPTAKLTKWPIIGLDCP
jgi:hypothetical protein